MCGRASRHDAALRVAAPLWHRCVLSCRRPRRSALTRAPSVVRGWRCSPGDEGWRARGAQAVASVEGCECQNPENNGSPTHATVSEPSAHTLKVAAYEVIQANACTGTGEHSASEARRCLYFLPSAGNAALPQPQGARARLAPPQPPPRGGAAASAHALATAAARRGARAGRFGPKKRAASRSSGPARQEESLR